MILIGLGSNLSGKYGPPQQAIKAGLSLLSEAGLDIISNSSIWKSAPVPISDQPWYHNAVCQIETGISPHDLLQLISKIEDDFGRTRCEINAARVIDLDIISYNNVQINDDRLNIPHQRMHERAFVLYPLQEIAPKWVHPIMNKSVDKMITELPKGQKIKKTNLSNIINKVAA